MKNISYALILFFGLGIAHSSHATIIACPSKALTVKCKATPGYEQNTDSHINPVQQVPGGSGANKSPCYCNVDGEKKVPTVAECRKLGGFVNTHVGYCDAPSGVKADGINLIYRYTTSFSYER